MTNLEKDYKELKPIIFKKLKKKNTCIETLEDCYNQAFLNLFTNPDEYNQIRNKSQYITTAVHWLMLNINTVNKRNFTVFNSSNIDDFLIELVPSNDNVYETLENKQLKLHIKKLIKNYPEKQKEAITSILDSKKIPGHYESAKTNYRQAVIKLKQDMKRLK